MLQLKIQRATTKTWHSKIKKNKQTNMACGPKNVTEHIKGLRDTPEAKSPVRLLPGSGCLVVLHMQISETTEAYC